MLHKLTLFKNVKITPDYSVVHDMTPSDWKDYLVGTPLVPTPNGEIVWEGMVNYYRLPDVIRIEGNYDTLRKVTYGMVDCARGTDETQLIINESMERPMFFFVKNVRLIKQESRVDKDEVSTPKVWDVKDVVELEIEVDVWSSNNGSFELYDSFVERRHMDRWKNTGTELNPTYEHIYYPNAGQGVDGAMKRENMTPISPFRQVIYHQGQADEFRVNFSTKCFLVTAIKPNGQQISIVCLDTHYPGYAQSRYLYHTYNSCRYLCIEDLLDGTFFTATGLTAENVQSVVCLPEPPYAILLYDIELLDSSGTKYLHLRFSNNSDVYYDDHDSGAYAWLTLDGLRGPNSHTKSVTVTKPDVTYLPATDPTGVYSHDEHEPMLYLSPARVRKITTGLGGVVIDIPDIHAFLDTVRWDAMYDMTSCVMVFFFNRSSTNINVEMNVEGDYGVVECATLPIYNSAWRSYEAINKIGDEIAYNAKQLQTVGGGVANAGLSAAGGFLMGGPVGAALGAAGTLIGAGLGAYGNEEELRAKQVTIRNSPANVKSGGSGLSAYLGEKTGAWYVTMKMDDQSFDKLRQMYYWFGYIVNRTFKGTIDLSTRKIFDFIKTNGAKVRGDLTAGAAQQIADIFNKGVTIYHGDNGYDKIGASYLYNNDEEWL